jgi:hypothetical protein
MSVVLSEEYFGSPDPETHEVINGPFSIHNYQCTVGSNTNLVRDYNPEETEAFYAQSLIDHNFGLWPLSYFSEYIEYGPHASVHSIMGGVHGQMSLEISPNDPLFCTCILFNIQGSIIHF